MSYWQEFIKTGAVSDCLNYKLKEEKRNVEEPNQIQGSGDKGKENR